MTEKKETQIKIPIFIDIYSMKFRISQPKNKDDGTSLYDHTFITEVGIFIIHSFQ